jgi:hypothetical protein
MNQNDLIACVNFFNDLTVKVIDITTDADKLNSNKVVRATYSYQKKEFTTQPLYYKEITGLNDVRHPNHLHYYFGKSVYWLDIEKHKWPRGSGESDLDTVVVNDITDDSSFRSLLLMLANNKQNGFIQKITRDGRPGQYYHNLENNNHWHDLVLWIKEVIRLKGEQIDRPFFQNLVFNWNKGKRTPLDAGYPYKIVKDLYNNIINIRTIMDIKEAYQVLHYKKQIILQGPPGTGKTKRAKELAREFIPLVTIISANEITKHIVNGLIIKSTGGRRNYYVEKIDAASGKIVLRRESESTDTTSFDEVVQAFQEKLWNQKLEQNSPRRAASLAKYIFDQINELKNCDQFKLVQFHPSYSYEDFVRGIVAKPDEDGQGIVYEAENKIIGLFAKQALDNYLASTGRNTVDLNFNNKLSIFLENIRNSIDNGEEFVLAKKSNAQVIAIKEDGILYSFPKRADIKYKLLFSDIEKVYMYSANITKPTDLKEAERKLDLSMKGKYPYYYMVLQHLLNIKSAMIQPIYEDLKNYILVIDEINRANLSAVLGELIYALEYRGEHVNSMYQVDGSNKMILPPNLLIIGTMNTADRSVGHIDYAIRRRFAFIDVLPRDLTAELGIDFKRELFEKVSDLFRHETYLSREFKPEDVQLGHSYFIQQYAKDESGNNIKSEPFDFKYRLEYEIKPILLEYIKDGVLIEKNKDELVTLINGLNNIV